GHMYWVYGRKAEAIALLEQVHEKQLIVLGGQHPSTLTTLWDLAEAYQAADGPAKALPLYQQAAAGIEKLRFEHDHADVILDALALCYEQSNQFDQAIAWRRKCLEIVERKYGKESDACAQELIRIASDLLRQEKPADAEPGLREALAIFD